MEAAAEEERGLGLLSQVSVALLAASYWLLATKFKQLPVFAALFAQLSPALAGVGCQQPGARG